jgi:hypothetical protein
VPGIPQRRYAGDRSLEESGILMRVGRIPFVGMVGRAGRSGNPFRGGRRALWQKSADRFPSLAAQQDERFERPKTLFGFGDRRR